jgi:hypothetical protein
LSTPRGLITNELTHSFAFVAAEIVHDHDIARSESAIREKTAHRICAKKIGKAISLYATNSGIFPRGKLDIREPDHALKPLVGLR